MESSRFLVLPTRLMHEHVESLKEGTKADAYKYVVYSAHDDSVLNMLRFFNVDFDWIPFASTFTIELKYSQKCVKANKDNMDGCIGVSVLNNNVPLRFPETCTGDYFTLNGCKWAEFNTLVTENWYSGPDSDDLDKACFQKPKGTQKPVTE